MITVHIKLENFISYQNNTIQILKKDLHDCIRYKVQSIQDNETVFLLSMVFEPHDTELIDNELFPLLAQEMFLNNIVNWYVILNSSFQEVLKYKIKNINTEKLLYLDYWALRTRYRCNLENQQINYSWNYLSNKALFLTGKAHVLNRIVLLSKFYDLDKLNLLEWSLYVNDGVKHRCRGLLSHYTDDQYEHFLNTCIRNPDNIEIWMQPESSHYDGFPYDVELYNNTLFSIISESFYIKKEGFISEKTYRAIVNNHPFVMAGTPHTLSLLNEFGFKTFENYMLINDYDSIKNHENRLDAIVENTLHFFNSIQKNYLEIKKDVEYNSNFFNEYCDKEFLKLKNIVKNSSNITADELLLKF